MLRPSVILYHLKAGAFINWMELWTHKTQIPPVDTNKIPTGETDTIITSGTLLSHIVKQILDLWS